MSKGRRRSTHHKGPFAAAPAVAPQTLVVQPTAAHETGEPPGHAEKAKSAWKDYVALVVACLSAVVAVLSLILTKRSNDAQIHSLTLHDRPWLSIDAFHPPNLDGSAGDQAIWEITNVGPVPATYADYYVYDKEQQDPLDAKDLLPPTPLPPPFHTAIPAGQPIRFGQKLNWPTCNSTALKNGVNVGYLCIQVDYVGVDDDHHMLRACEQYAHDSWSIVVPSRLPTDAW